MLNSELLPFSKAKEILSGIDESSLIQYEGGIQTQIKTGDYSVNVIEIKVAFDPAVNKNEPEQR